MTDKDSDILTERLSDYIQTQNLVATEDPQVERGEYQEHYRRPGFEGIRSMDEFDDLISQYIKDVRQDADLTQGEFGFLLGLSKGVYGRYERAESKLHVTRFIVICELLNLNPIEMLYVVAPHLFGETMESATSRVQLMMKLSKLPEAAIETLDSLVGMLNNQAQ